MAQLKMLKEPSKPKLPKKPSQSATLASKTAYIRKVRDISEKYAALKKSVAIENAKRAKVNAESKKLSQVISGINGIEVFSKGFSVRKVRLPRPGAKVAGVKKRKPTTAKRKPAAKRKSAAKRK